MPQTFILPHEYNKFVAAFYEHQNGQNDKEDAKDKQPNLWILKPVGLSRGRGISLVSDLSDVKYDMQTVVQSCEFLCLNLMLTFAHFCLIFTFVPSFVVFLYCIRLEKSSASRWVQMGYEALCAGDFVRSSWSVSRCIHLVPCIHGLFLFP